MKRRITLELGSMSAPVLRATGHLLRDPRLSWRVRLVTSPRDMPGPDVLRLELGSLISPLLSVLWGGDSVPSETSQVSLGLSTAVFLDKTSNDGWRRAGAALPRLNVYGTPDPHRPWVLVGPGSRIAPPDLERVTGLTNPQVHLLSPPLSFEHMRSVYWVPSGGTLASLLRRVDAVVAPNGPLVWDARRIQARHFNLAGHGVPDELANRRLARLLPERLASDGAFWRSFVTELLDGSWPTRWNTARWIHQARDGRSHDAALTVWRFKRKLLKLRRNPALFVADSKFFKLAAKNGWVPHDLFATAARNSTSFNAHPFFDPDWYAAQLDTPLHGESALGHYLREGAARGLSPHPLFDVNWYLAQLHEPLAVGESALEHYLRVGAAARLSPHPLFDANRYARHPPVASGAPLSR